MIDYTWTETNTEIVLTFTGNTDQLLQAIESPFDLSVGMDQYALDGLLDLVTEKYIYEPESSDPDEWKWLKVVIDNGVIRFEHTLTEIAAAHHLVQIRHWSFA